jgi:hypothetical protein
MSEPTDYARQEQAMVSTVNVNHDDLVNVDTLRERLRLTPARPSYVAEKPKWIKRQEDRWKRFTNLPKVTDRNTGNVYVTKKAADEFTDWLEADKVKEIIDSYLALPRRDQQNIEVRRLQNKMNVSFGSVLNRLDNHRTVLVAQGAVTIASVATAAVALTVALTG